MSAELDRLLAGMNPVLNDEPRSWRIRRTSSGCWRVERLTNDGYAVFARVDSHVKAINLVSAVVGLSGWAFKRPERQAAANADGVPHHQHRIRNII